MTRTINIKSQMLGGADFYEKELRVRSHAKSHDTTGHG
jgi:hypothetical protein